MEKAKEIAVLSWSLKHARNWDIPHPRDFEVIRDVG
jgi:hypothetical protein